MPTRIASINAQRHLSNTTDRLASTFTRLASGMRINNASDDAAGLAIAESLRADSRVYAQGIRNVNDGISALNIAQGALQQLSSIVTRQLELSQQAANGSYSLNQRKSLNTEANSLVQEFNRIIASTTFNQRTLLDGSMQELRLQLGYGMQGSIDTRLGSQFTRNIGTGSFTASTSFTFGAGSAAQSIVSGDVNGDGIQDLVTVGIGTSLQVNLGNSDGSFGAATLYTVPSNARNVVLGDLNNDGALDIVVSSSATATNSVLINNGNGTYGAATSLTTGAGAWLLELGDVNNDGVLDMISAPAGGSSRIEIRLGVGNGTFGAISSFQAGGLVTNNLRDIRLSDVNGDGNLDLFSLDIDANRVFLLLGNGNGTFGAVQTVIDGFSDPSSIDVRDVNGDGIPDLFIGGINASFSLLGNGDGTFRTVFSSSGSSSMSNVTLADLNNDGVLDVMGFSTTGSVIRFGNGDGTYGAERTQAIGSGFDYANRNFTLLDLNGDGVLDLVSAGSNASSQIRINLSNTSTTTTQEQLNLLDQENARSSLTLLGNTLSRITRELGAIGANQARLGVAAQNLMVSRENFLSAESRIRDADIATEAAEQVRLSILQQIGTSVLGQANIQPQIALRLLGRS